MNNQNECLSKKIAEINSRKKDNCCNYIPFIIPPGPTGPAGTSPTVTVGTVTAENHAALTITTLAGGASPASAHLVITQIS